MKMFLNYNGIWKSGTYAVVPAEIYDEVEIILPEGFKEVTMQDETKAVCNGYCEKAYTAEDAEFARIQIEHLLKSCQ